MILLYLGLVHLINFDFLHFSPIFEYTKNQIAMKKQLLSIFSIISFTTAFAQIPNNGMESWGASFFEPEGPTSYVSANYFASPLVSATNPTSVTKVTGADAYAGTFSAKITTVKLVANPASATIPDTVGVLMLGAVSLSSSPPLKSGTPWTTRLNSVDFFYKYTPVNNDNGAMIAYLTKWNGTTRDTIATAGYPITGTVSAYMSASGPFVYDPGFPNTTLPDSLHVYFASSARPWLNNAFVPNPARLGSALWVDEVSVTTVGLKETIKLGTQAKVFPNPSTNYFNISVANENATTAEIFDVTGKKIASALMEDGKVRINTENFNEGLYIYAVKDKNNKVIATGKINVSK